MLLIGAFCIYYADLNYQYIEPSSFELFLLIRFQYDEWENRAPL